MISVNLSCNMQSKSLIKLETASPKLKVELFTIELTLYYVFFFKKLHLYKNNTCILIMCAFFLVILYQKILKMIMVPNFCCFLILHFVLLY